MKFNEGDQVIVTRVPERAQPNVMVGMMGVIDRMNSAEEAAHAAESGLTKVVLNGFTFWWCEDALAPLTPVPVVKLTIIDEGPYTVPNFPNRKRLSAYTRGQGYDPYNSAELHRYAVRWGF